MPRTLPTLQGMPPLEAAPNRKRWSRRECAFLVQSGLLTGRYELVNGEVIVKMGQNPPHAYVITRIMTWLVALFGGDFVRVQLPIDVADADNEMNEPEPDAAVLARPAEAFLASNPGPSDLLLVVEVADATLRFDLRNKAVLYARAGIADYWVVDLPGRRIVVHRQPGPEGYGEVLEYQEAERVSPLSRPEAGIAVADLLPPAQAPSL